MNDIGFILEVLVVLLAVVAASTSVIATYVSRQRELYRERARAEEALRDRGRPDALATMESTVERLSAQMAIYETRQRQDHETILRLERTTHTLRQYSEMTYRLLVSLGQTDVPPPPTDGWHPPLPNNSSLHAEMMQRFSIEEVDDLAQRLGLDPEELEGDTRQKRIWSLISSAERRDMVDNLVTLCRVLRPMGKWS